MTDRAARYPWWMDLAAWAGAAALTLLGRTWRVEKVGMEAQEAALARGERCLFAFWHARLLPLTFAHRGAGHVVLVSRHRDGELVARVMTRLGYDAARGSSTRGGEEGVREMLEWHERGRVLGVTPDGPRGPAERVKPGIVYLASRTGLPVVPVSAASPHAWRLRSWDRFRIPRPFARVLMGYAPPIAVPPNLDRDALEEWTQRIEQALTKLTRELDERAGEAS